MLALIGLSLSLNAQTPYIITTGSSATEFKVTKGGTAIGTQGTIGAVIENIKNDANGVNCAIQFGNGSKLDIGASGLDFEPSGVGWGKIALSGSLTSVDSWSGTIRLRAGISIESTANIENTNDVYTTTCYAITNNGGTLTIHSGTISAMNRGKAVENSGELTIINANISASREAIYNSEGTVTIHDGTFSSEGETSYSFATVANYGRGTIIINDGTFSVKTSTGATNKAYVIDYDNGSTSSVSGEIIINGGTFSAEGATASAIHSRYAKGKIVLSGDAQISNTGSDNPTIYLDSPTDVQLEISGKAIIKNNSEGKIVMSSSSSSSILLGGSPKIEGHIDMWTRLQFEIIEGFTPGENIYMLYANRFLGCKNLAVINGKDFLENFKLTDDFKWKLRTENNDLYIRCGGYTNTGTDYVIPYFSSSSQSPQTIIDAIKTDAKGADCSIRIVDTEYQLTGGGTEAWTSHLDFDNTDNGWGKITLLGTIISSYNSPSYHSGVIYLTGNVFMDSQADIENTNSSQTSAIRNDGTGTLTISGGNIKAVNNPVYNGSTGTIAISGGKVSTTATTSCAVYNASTGKIVLSGNADISSLNNNSSASGGNGTIHIANSGTTTEARLEITGGKISNTANSTANAVYNASTANIALGGNPEVIGRITRGNTTAGNMEVIAGFVPNKNIYTLYFQSYAENNIAVVNGKGFVKNFALYNQSNWGLAEKGNDIVIAKGCGCTDPYAVNYNSNASIDNGSCIFKTIDEPVAGCTNPASLNYNPVATVDDASCIEEQDQQPICGCNDTRALNYNPLATVYDNSCVYANEENAYHEDIIEPLVDTVGTQPQEDCQLSAGLGITSAIITGITLVEGNVIIAHWEIVQNGETVYYDVEYTIAHEGNNLFYLSIICKSASMGSALRAGVDVTGYTVSAMYNVELTNGIYQIKKEAGNVVVYPNPFTDKLIVSVNEAKTADISLYSVEGKLLANYLNLNETHIATGNLSAGIYVLKVRVDGVVETLRVVRK